MKNKFKRFIATLMSLVMITTVLPLKTLAAEWGVGDNVYAAMLGDYIGSDGGTYGDKRNYTYIYYKSDGSTGTATRYASTHAKLGISKNGVTQQAICIEAGVSYSTGSSYVGKDTSDAYMQNLPPDISKALKYALLCGFNSDTKSSPVSGTNLDDFSFATQIIVWEIQQQLRTGYNKSDLTANKWGTPAKVYYEQLEGRPAEKCYDYILGKMKSYSLIPSFTRDKKENAKTYELKYDSTTKKYSVTLTDSNKSGMPASAFNISGVTVTKSGYDYTFSTTTKISGTKTCTYKANRTSGDQLVIWKSGNGSQTMASGIDDPVEFYANFKTESTGTAQIKKVWEHNNDSSSTQASNSDIYFTIKNSSGTTIKGTGSAGSYTYSASGSVSQFKLNSSNTFSLKSLPAGTYTVYEYGSGTNGAIPYYTRTGGASKTVTVAAGGTGTVTFTNTRNIGTGEIVKTWVDTNGNALPASSYTQMNSQIYFYIKNADNEYITVSGTNFSGTYSFTGTSTTAKKLYVNPGTGKFTVSNMPTGKYTVYEYGSPEGYTVNKASQTVNITSGNTASVSFVNSEDSGAAQINKKWVSASTLTTAEIAELEKNVYFTVTDEDGNYIKVTGSAGSYTYAGTQTAANNMKLSGSKFRISKLPVGKYTVTETNNASGYSPKTQSQTVTVSKNSTGSITFTNKSAPVVVIRKHFSDEDNLTADELKEQYEKVTVNLVLLGYVGQVQTTPPAGYYATFTGSKGNYTFSGLSATLTSACDLKLDDNGEVEISFSGNTAPYYFSVVENYSGTDYSIDSRDQRIDLGDGNPNKVIELEDITLENQLNPGSVQIDKEFLNENGAVENITDEQLSQVSFKIMHNGKYLTFDGSDGSYTYTGENNTGTALKLSTSTYNFVASGLPAKEQYTVYEVSGTTGYSFSVDPVTFEITPNGTVRKVFTNKAMTGTISIAKHSADGVLSGWQFRVTGTAKTGQIYDKTFTTDSYGNITISNLRIGDYTVTEVKTSKTVGYITESSKAVTVKTDAVSYVEFENKPYGHIAINKIDAKTGEKVTGATFGIYADSECMHPAQAYKSDTDSTLVNAVITETETGKYTCSYLPIDSVNGTVYYVKELTAPTGYYLDADVHAVTLTTANATVYVSNDIGSNDFLEYPYGHAQITKEWILDNGTNDLTADELAAYKAQLENSLYFTIKDSSGNYITATGSDGVYKYASQSATEYRFTLKNGTFNVAELPTGTYTVEEHSSLSDYTIKSTNPVTITVVRNKTAQAKFINERDTSTAQISKSWVHPETLTSAQIAQLESNVKFTVKNANGEYLKASTATNGKYTYKGVQTTESYFVLNNSKFEIVELPTGTYTITEYNNAVGYLPLTQSKTITVTKGKTATAAFVNEVILGNVHTTKVDKDYPDNKLTGAEFTVYKTDKTTVVDTLTEISVGEYQLDDLPYGDYYLKETKAPKNYVLDSKYYAFSIRTDGATVNVETAAGKGFENDAMRGTLKVIKHSADGVIEGWQFKVELVSSPFTDDYSYSQTFTTNKNGEIIVENLRIGTYKVTEITTGVTGYFTPEAQTVEVKYNNTTTVNMTNVPYGSVHVTKVDKDYPDNKLTGAEFTVYKSDKATVVDTLTEISVGEYQLDDLPYGDYYLKETKAPENYVLDANYYAFSIREADVTVNVETAAGKGFENDAMRGTLKVVKHSADNVIKGWQFKIELVSSPFTDYTYSQTFTTDANGEIVVENLRIGTYKVTEITTGVTGYFTPEAQDIVIKHNETSTADMTNVPYGTIVLNKVDADNISQFVSGSIYAVYKDVNENGTYEADVDTFVSNLTESNGVYSLNEVTYGRYLVKEISAPAGYLVDENYYPINIDGADVEKIVSNTEDGNSFVEQPVRGSVEITKVDEDYPDNKLSGAEFTIFAEDKTTIIGKMTEVETGVYRYDGLRYGKYYLQETKAPDYFVQDVNFYYFEITENGKTVVVTNDELGKGTFINSPAKGEIKIVKTSYDNKVEGIHFEVTGTTYTGQSFSKIYTTDENGIIHITDLRAGEYNIHEVADDASAGYLLPTDTLLTIDRDGVMAVAEMYNDRIPENPTTGDSTNNLMQPLIFVSAAVTIGTAAVILIPMRKRKKQR